MKNNQLAVLLTGLLATLPVVTVATAPAEAQGLRSRRSVPSSLGNGNNSSASNGRDSSSSNQNNGGNSSSRRDSTPRDVSPQPQQPRGSFDRPALPGGVQRDSYGYGRDTRNGGGNTVVLPPKGPLPPSSGNLPVFSRSRRDRSDSVVLPPKPTPQGDLSSRPSLPNGLERRRDRDRYGYDDRWSYNYGYGYGYGYPSDTVIRLGDYGVTVFRGYGSVYVPGQTYLSPFGVYNCPPFIGSTHVVSAPYIYIGGRELNTIRPYDDRNSYAATNGFRARALRAALNDLTRFWEENDTRALRRRVSTDFAVAVLEDERHAYSLRRGDFLDLSSDALDRVTTLSLRFDSVRERSDGLVNAYATHVYRVHGDESQTPRVATVRYTLVHVDGDWFVSAVSLAPEVARSR